MAPLPRAQVERLRTSEIRIVANAGIGRADVLPFWFGEADQPAAPFIRRAAAEALEAGLTFYSHNLGRPDLREALSRYLQRLHARSFDGATLAITSSGVNALMLACQAVVEPLDRVVVITPVWPNLVEIPRILSAEVIEVALRPIQGRWTLDLDELLGALTPKTRLLVLNSPNNPTGWVLPASARAPILERCRAIGAWVLADDVYERLTFGDLSNAPSFLLLAEPEDRVISTNSFSKSWRMTGFRLGWIAAPCALAAAIGALIEYNTSCAPEFVQIAGREALLHGDDEIESFRRELATARIQVTEGLKALGGVEAEAPDGGLYVFFRIPGGGPSIALAKNILERVGLGLAPGSAFGPQGEGWLRWCFAARPEKNAEGLARLGRYLADPA